MTFEVGHKEWIRYKRIRGPQRHYRQEDQNEQEMTEFSDEADCVIKCWGIHLFSIVDFFFLSLHIWGIEKTNTKWAPLNNKHYWYPLIWKFYTRFYFFSFLIYSIIYLYWYKLMYIYFVLWVIIIQYLTTEDFSVWFLYSFNTHPSVCFLNTSLLSDTTKRSRITLYFPCPGPISAIYPSSPGSFYWRMAFRNQDLVAKFVHCSSGFIISSHSQQTE